MDTTRLIAYPEPYEEYDLGPLKRGKEAEVFLVERVAPDGRSCLLAHKRYPPREVGKGDLERLGFQRATTFVHDTAYRGGRSFGNSRDGRAAAKKTRYGRGLLRNDWADNEFDVLQRLHTAGVSVPEAIERTADGILMQYLGDRTMAAPRLIHAGLSREQTADAAGRLVDNLRVMVTAGVVHADLSVFNILWWSDTLWVIDLPQAVDIATNERAWDFLHRDVANVGAWFRSKGVDFDVDGIFGELVASAL